jgi:segregation and condensation protein B
MNENVDISTASPAGESGPEVTTDSIIEAMLLSTDVPLTGAKLAQLLGIGDAADVKPAIVRLNERYAAQNASFRIDLIAKGYQMLTLPVYDRWVSKLHKARAESRLSQAALETLAIVAYKQPVLRAQIEAIRGVAVGDMLVRLREINLIRIVGRAEEIGRPLLYGTTGKFLEVFGLGSLKDLPKVEQDTPDAVPVLKTPDAENI